MLSKTAIQNKLFKPIYDYKCNSYILAYIYANIKLRTKEEPQC